jgi:sugar lactone lactonase YvrE
LVCATAVAEAHEGWGIVVQPDGTIYFTDIPANTIWRLRADGVLEVAAADKHSHALMTRADGTIYGTHEQVPFARPGEVWEIGPTGQLRVAIVAEPGFPMSLHPFAIDASGAVYSTSVYAGVSGPLRIMRRAPDGNFSTLAGAARGMRDGMGTEAQFEGVDGIALAPDGALIVSDGAAIRRVALDGSVVTIAGSLTESVWGEDLMGVTLHGDAIYVADYSSSRVLRVREQQSADTVLATRWPWAPTGVAFRGDEMYVLEHLRMPMVILGNLQMGPYVRVRRVAADGTVTTVKTVWGRSSWVLGLLLVAFVGLIALIVRRRRRVAR